MLSRCCHHRSSVYQFKQKEGIFADCQTKNKKDVLIDARLPSFQRFNLKVPKTQMLYCQSDTLNESALYYHHRFRFLFYSFNEQQYSFWCPLSSVVVCLSTIYDLLKMQIQSSFHILKSDPNLELTFTGQVPFHEKVGPSFFQEESFCTNE